MDVLLTSDKNKFHYVYIKDFDRFMCDKAKNKNKKHFCKFCLQCFSKEKMLIEHKENCLAINGKQSVKLKNGSISLKNYFKNLLFLLKFMLKNFFIFMFKSSDRNNGSYTEKCEDHNPCSFVYKVILARKLFFTEKKNVVYTFIKAILEEYGYCKKMIKKNLIMSAEEEERFQLSNNCWICDKLFDVRDKKVRDHCHITGKYRGAAHWSCNINFKLIKKILVIFHNLRGYDIHLIIKEIGKLDVKISIIPNGSEKYMAFTINRNFVFIDSMQFMNSSLDSLVKNLPDNDFKYLSEEFSGEFLRLVKQKGVYPNEHMESFKKFFEDKLPDRCKFFNSLKDVCISEKGYLKADNIWNVFKMNTMGDLNLKTDVLLLADVFEKFINTCLNFYRIDPCHYFSSPGLSRDAVLKMTEIELDLISYIDMHLFIQKGMRGGISYVAKRHNKANNKYMECYYSSEEVNTLLILMQIIYVAGH